MQPQDLEAFLTAPLDSFLREKARQPALAKLRIGIDIQEVRPPSLLRAMWIGDPGSDQQTYSRGNASIRRNSKPPPVRAVT